MYCKPLFSSNPRLQLFSPQLEQQNFHMSRSNPGRRCSVGLRPFAGSSVGRVILHKLCCMRCKQFVAVPLYIAKNAFKHFAYMLFLSSFWFMYEMYFCNVQARRLIRKLLKKKEKNHQVRQTIRLTHGRGRQTAHPFLCYSITAEEEVTTSKQTFLVNWFNSFRVRFLTTLTYA